MTTSSISFTKMHGLGNDFVIINAINKPLSLQQIPISTLANRHVGIGFDQLLVIQPSTCADFFCRIFNADGSEAEQCGNGLRCIARFLHENGLHKATLLTLETKAGVFPISIVDYDHIRVAISPPKIQEKLTRLNLADHPVEISVLSLGNPHAIMKVESLDNTASAKLGPEISMHQSFAKGANVGFMEILERNHIRLKTFERGSGETNACGSNACAAVCAGIINGWLENEVNVEFRYGNLFIKWQGDQTPVEMTGPATTIFSGEFTL